VLVIPIRYIFRSRWAALAWAAGICWTAVNVAGGDEPHDEAAIHTENAFASVNAALSR
jgi:hypothetical protein